MNIGKELLQRELGQLVLSYLDEADIDYGSLANQKAVGILEEIQELFLEAKDDIGSELSAEESAQQDFEILDRILSIFHQNNLSTGKLHDY